MRVHLTCYWCIFIRVWAQVFVNLLWINKNNSLSDFNLPSNKPFHKGGKCFVPVLRFNHLVHPFPQPKVTLRIVCYLKLNQFQEDRYFNHLILVGWDESLKGMPDHGEGDRSWGKSFNIWISRRGQEISLLLPWQQPNLFSPSLWLQTIEMLVPGGWCHLTQR